MTLKKYVVDREAADNVAVLRSVVPVVGVGKARQIPKQCFVVGPEYVARVKGDVCVGVVVEMAHVIASVRNEVVSHFGAAKVHAFEPRPGVAIYRCRHATVRVCEV